MKIKRFIPAITYFALSIIFVHVLTACVASKTPIDLTVKAKLAEPVNSVKISHFTSSDKIRSNSFQIKLASEIKKYGYITVLKNGAESDLSGSLSIGRVIENRHQTSYTQEKKVNGKKQKVTIQNYHVTKRHTVSVDFELVRDGEILGGDSISYDYENSWSADSYAQASANAATDNQIIESQLSLLAKKISHYISPHKEEIKMVLLDGANFGLGAHQGLATGVTYFEHQRYDQAEGLWQQVIDKETTPNIVAMAYYNRGVIRMIKSQYSEAFKLFAEADSLEPGNKHYIEALMQAERAGGNTNSVEEAWGTESSATAKLTVVTMPEGATVRVMTIKPKYKDGISLPPGSHRIKVLHPGYATVNDWYMVDPGPNILTIKLKKQ